VSVTFGEPDSVDLADCLTFPAGGVRDVSQRTGGRVAGRVVVGIIRVQEIRRQSGRWSYTILWPEGSVYEEADRFLRRYEGSGSQRTYAYLLVDHLRWLEREALPLDAVKLRDLERYMGIMGAEVRMPLGEPWRAGKRPYGKDSTAWRRHWPVSVFSKTPSPWT
jgi:hypothetical protein